MTGMRLLRTLGGGAAALALGLCTVPAQAAGDASLDAATHAYFDAVFKADGGALASTTSRAFHVISFDGKRLSSDDYFKQIFLANTLELPPVGDTVAIKAESINGDKATQTVLTQHWYGGAQPSDPMMGPVMERDFETHQLTWVKSPSGAWLLDEDHITAETRM